MFFPFKKSSTENKQRQPGSSLSTKDKIKHKAKDSIRIALPWMSVLLLITIIVVPSTLFIWFLFYTDIFVVQAITVLDAREHTKEEAHNIIEQGVKNAILPKNIFFIPTDIIEDKIISSIPQVRTVHVTRKLPGTIKAVIQEKTPVLLLLSNGQYYFIDQGGVPYEEAKLDILPGVVLPIVKNSNQNSKVTIGVPAIASSFVSFVQTIQKKLPETIGAQVVETRIPSLSAREVHFILDNNWQLKFDTTREAQAQLDILDRVVNETIPEKDRELLEYVDLRIHNRIYYKTKNGDLD